MRLPLFLSILLFANAAQGQDWQTVDFRWNSSPAKVGSGSLKLSLGSVWKAEKIGTKTTKEGTFDVYSFWQDVTFTKKLKSVVVSSCSVVTNLDTSVGVAGISLREDGKRAVLQMEGTTSFLKTPRICIEGRT